MKKTISMLFTCALMTTGCGHAEIPEPMPAPTCQKPRGSYMLDGKVTQGGDGMFCPAPTGQNAAIGFDVGVEGDVASVYNMPCTTTYSADGCALKALCSVAYFDGTRAEEYSFDVSPDGRMLRGRYETTGTGVYCSRALVEGTAIVAAP